MDAAPSWFVAFSLNVAEFMKEIRQDFRDLSTRIAALEADSTKSKSNQADIKAIREEVDALSHTHALTDSCEIMISGVPSQLSYNQVVDNVSAALDLPSAGQFIVEAREWKARIPKPKDRKISTPQPSHDSYSLHHRSPSIGVTNRRSVVLKLSSSCVRDTFISRASKLARTNAQAVFGMGGSSRVFIQPLWPEPVYKLWRSALVAQQTLKYARPIIRNLSIFMRKTRDSRLIPIYSQQDLDALDPLEDN